MRGDYQLVRLNGVCVRGRRRHLRFMVVFLHDGFIASFRCTDPAFLRSRPSARADEGSNLQDDDRELRYEDAQPGEARLCVRFKSLKARLVGWFR